MLKKIRKGILARKEMILFFAVLLALLVNALYCYALSDSRTVLAFSCALAGAVALLYCAHELVEKRISAPVEVWFLVFVLTLGLLYSLVFAPSTVPDEMYHFESSYKLADQIMFLAPTTDSMSVRADDASMISTLFEGGNRLTAEQYGAVAGSSFVVGDTSLVSIVPVSSFDWGGNPPQLKLPSALGIIIAQILHLGSYPLFYVGRFFNLAFFAVLVFFAVRNTPVCKNAMMVIALLPMTLHVASSYSYDAGIIGYSFLLTALCLKAVYEKGPISMRLRVGIAAFALLLAPCKVIYSLIIMLVLLIPRERFSSNRVARMYKAGIFVLCIFFVALLRGAFIAQLAGAGAEEGGTDLVRGTETGSHYTLGILIGDPLNTGLMFIRTMDVMGDYYIKTTIGGFLGWFQPELQASWYVVLAFLVLLALSFIKSPEEQTHVPAKHRTICFMLVCLGWLAVMVTMTLDFTFLTENTILGVQGRYIIPLLPLLAVALRGNLVVAQKNLSRVLIWGMLCLNVAYLMRLFAIAVNVH